LDKNINKFTRIHLDKNRKMNFCQDKILDIKTLMKMR